MGSRGNVGFLRAAGYRLLAKPGASPGFALLVVLWVLVLISFMIAQLVAQGRTEIRIADNIYANAAAEAALDGAVSVAVYKLSDPQPEQRWVFDGSLHELAVGKSRIVLRIENEAWRINPNFASPALLEGLLRATGSDKETARQLSIAIAEWVGATITGRSPEDAAADYRAAGRDYRPPRQPIERLDELARVLGFTPEVLAAIRPHLTVYGPPAPDYGCRSDRGRRARLCSRRARKRSGNCSWLGAARRARDGAHLGDREGSRQCRGRAEFSSPVQSLNAGGLCRAGSRGRDRIDELWAGLAWRIVRSFEASLREAPQDEGTSQWPQRLPPVQNLFK